MKKQHLSPSTASELGTVTSPSEVHTDLEKGTEADEFQITIRKLQTPVRPRGVLAE